MLGLEDELAEQPAKAGLHDLNLLNYCPGAVPGAGGAVAGDAPTGGCCAAGAGRAVGAACAGVGTVVVGAPCGARPPTTDPGPRCARMFNVSAPTRNSTARTVVARVSTVAPLRAPNAAWLLPPPNAAAMSPPFPCWRRMTPIIARQART